MYYINMRSFCEIFKNFPFFKFKIFKSHAELHYQYCLKFGYRIGFFMFYVAFIYTFIVL